jgi:hypothetical protein
MTSKTPSKMAAGKSASKNRLRRSEADNQLAKMPNGGGKQQSIRSTPALSQTATAMA